VSIGVVGRTLTTERCIHGPWPWPACSPAHASTARLNKKSPRRRRSVGGGQLSGGAAPSSAAADEASEAASSGADEVLDVVDELDVASADVQAAAAARRDGAVRLRAALVVRPLSALGQHPLRLASLRLRELSGDDDQTQVDHEKRTDLYSTTRVEEPSAFANSLAYVTDTLH